jgi:hypothetical protein
MNIEKHSRTFFGIPFLRIALVLTILVVAMTACNLPGRQPIESEELVDTDAHTYRMYADSSTDETTNDLRIRRFVGQLRLADIEDVFGEVEALPRDDNGNYVGGPILEDGLVWSLVMSPSKVGANLVTSDVDGTVSSALDLDGDRIADIVDIRLGDGRRISFVTEELGMGVFEHWLLGQNPLCNDPLTRQLGLDGFGCGDGADGSSGGGIGASAGNGIGDPWALICSEYNSSHRLSSPTRAQWGVRECPGCTREFTIGGNVTSSGDRVEITEIRRDSEGHHLGTTRIIRDYDIDGNLLQEVREEVQPDGTGVRTVRQKYPEEGHPSRYEESFETDVEDDGNYYTELSEPPPPTPRTPPASGSSGSQPDPGPEGDDSNIAAFCARRGNTTSGVERAAATDPSAFRLGCGDLVGAPSPGDDCTIIEWAAPEDFDGAIHPPGDDDGCGEFNERGAGGDCEPSNAIEFMRGRTALLASANLQGLVICPPIVCNPPFAGQSQVLSSSGENLLEPVTVTPAAGACFDTCDPDNPNSCLAGLICLPRSQGSGEYICYNESICNPATTQEPGAAAESGNDVCDGAAKVETFPVYDCTYGDGGWTYYEGLRCYDANGGLLFDGHTAGPFTSAEWLSYCPGVPGQGDNGGGDQQPQPPSCQDAPNDPNCIP